MTPNEMPPLSQFSYLLPAEEASCVDEICGDEKVPSPAIVFKHIGNSVVTADSSIVECN